MKKKILFVCLGNICRSPAAEGVMKTMVANAGKSEEYEIDSAGIGNWHVGELPDIRMRRRASLRGYKLNSHARQFKTEDFEQFDYIFVMDNDNYHAITSITKTIKEKQKVKMLASYVTKYKGVSIIPDPYYGNEKDFDYVLDLIEDAVKNIIQVQF